MTIETLIFYNYRNYLCTSNSHNELIESGYNDCFTIIYLQNNIGNVCHVLIVRMYVDIKIIVTTLIFFLYFITWQILVNKNIF